MHEALVKRIVADCRSRYAEGDCQVTEQPSPGQMEEAIRELADALLPFANVAEHDIGDDETDDDRFQPMSKPFARAKVLTVGDLRRAFKITGGEAK